MVAPVLSVRIDWRNDGFNSVANDGFETDTTGWVAGTGVTLTRITSSPYVGVASAQVVTAATTGSGTYYFPPGLFTGGRKYRLSVALKSVSGTTSAQIVIRSNGTPADGAILAQTITTTWTVYNVDWTPSANRSDVVFLILNNTAAVMTANIDHVELFELIDEVTTASFRGYPEALTFGRGASFDGASEAPGGATLSLVDPDGRYARENTGSPLYGLIKPNRPIWIRATYAGVVYPLYYGTVRRFIPRPADKMVDLQCEDPLHDYARAETSVALSGDRSLVFYRHQILDDLGEPAVRRDLATDSPEQAKPFNGADQRDALDALVEINAATGTTHFIQPHASSSVRYRYRTIARTSIASTSVVEGYYDDINDLTGYDITDEAVINLQRVRASPSAAEAPMVVWSSGNVSLTANQTITLWPQYETSVINQVLITVFSSGGASTTFTAFRDTGKIVITAGAGGAVFDNISVSGQPVTVVSLQSVVYSDTASVTEHGTRAGSEVTSALLSSTAEADGLARWIVYRYANVKPRPTITVVNRLPSQLTRDIADRILLAFARLFMTGTDYLIRSFTTTVSDAGNLWTTTYVLEEAPPFLTYFRLGGTAAEGLGGTGILAY